MNDVLLDDARLRRAGLVEELQQVGAIRSPAWAQAFLAVPRHEFLPRWFEQDTDGRGITVWRERDASDREAWLSAVYRDKTLVTALDPGTARQVGDRAWTGIATSSSTLPRLMAGMLDDLAVSDGQKVLEIGTGTGYNAALLSARVGDSNVYSVDIDPELVEAARGRLATIGYTPHLSVGDGRNGYPTHAGFDRIIATCSVGDIPAAWIEQTSPGGMILGDLQIGIEGGLIRLLVDAGRQARGHFTRTTGRFMPARDSARSYPERHRKPAAPAVTTRPTSVTAADVRTLYPFRLLLGLTLPQAELVYHRDDASALSLQIQEPDGTWARAPLTGETGAVTYGGTHDLWVDVEDAWQWWNEQNRPDQTRFGVTREPDGRLYVWYVPDGRRWDVGP